MREFLKIFEGGKVMEVAETIGAENNVLTDIRRIFEVKHSCFWDKNTGMDEIRKLLTEYNVVKESNAILNTMANSLEGHTVSGVCGWGLLVSHAKHCKQGILHW